MSIEETRKFSEANSLITRIGEQSKLLIHNEDIAAFQKLIEVGERTKLEQQNLLRGIYKTISSLQIAKKYIVQTRLSKELDPDGYVHKYLKTVYQRILKAKYCARVIETSLQNIAVTQDMIKQRLNQTVVCCLTEE